VYLIVRSPPEDHSQTLDAIREAVWAYGRAHRHGTALLSRPFHVARLSTPRERGAGGAVISPPLTSVVSTAAQAVEPQRRTAWARRGRSFWSRRCRSPHSQMTHR